MKILYSHYLNQDTHPAARMVHRISHYLGQMGHEVLVHASAGLEPHPTGPNATASAFQERTSLIPYLKSRVWWSKALYRNRARLTRDREAIASFQPDIVLTRQDAYSWSTMQAAIEKNLPRVTYADAPVAYETRSVDSERRWHPPFVLERIEKWGLKNSDAVITVSNPAAERLKMYGLDVPIYANPNGVDADRYESITEASRAEKRAELGIDTELVIGFQGSFKIFHGVDRLAELILATRDRTNVTWLLIGDGTERPALESSVRDCNHVRFLGRRHPDEMAGLLSTMDIAVAPHTKIDGDFYFCPLKILEHAASGCATLASNQGDIPMLLNDGAGGLIVDKDDLNSWVQALNHLIDDRSLRESIAENARNHVINHLTWRHTAERASDILTNVVNQATPELAAS